MNPVEIFAYIAVFLLFFDKDFQRKFRESTRETAQPLILAGLMLAGLGVIASSAATFWLGIGAVLYGLLILGTHRR